MRLVDNWRRIVAKAWSLRLNVLVALASGVDAAATYIVDGRLGASLGVFFMSVGASVARVVKQETVSGADE